MNIQTELLEHLIRQCVREVLDQVTEDKKPKLSSSKIGKGGESKTIPVKFGKTEKFKKSVQVNEEEEDNKSSEDDSKPSFPEPEASSSPASEPAAEEPFQPEEPEASQEPSAEPGNEPPQSGPDQASEPPPPSLKGAILVNPKDKSKLQPMPLRGDDASIERALHQIAVAMGSRTKVSLAAKRMAREVAKNPSTSVFFYLGKMDPESEEIFLLADKSLQVAKDESVPPTEIGGVPMTHLTPSYQDLETADDRTYANYLNNRNAASSRYGIDENLKKMIKTMVNRMLDAKN